MRRLHQTKWPWVSSLNVKNNLCFFLREVIRGETLNSLVRGDLTITSQNCREVRISQPLLYQIKKSVQRWDASPTFVHHYNEWMMTSTLQITETVPIVWMVQTNAISSNLKLTSPCKDLFIKAGTTPSQGLLHFCSAWFLPWVQTV